MLLSLKDMQLYESEMLRNIVDVCTASNITMYVVGGTAIAAVRHHGPIPWDPDVDIGIPVNEFVTACRTLSRELPAKYEVDCYEVNGKDHIVYGKVGLKGYSNDVLHVDVFPLIGMPDDELERITFFEKTFKLKSLYVFKSQSIQRDKLLKRCFIKLLPVSKLALRKKYYKAITKYDYSTAKYVFIAQGTYDQANVFYPKKLFGKPLFVKYDDFYVPVPKGYDELLTLRYGDYMTEPPESETRSFLSQKYYIAEQ